MPLFAVKSNKPTKPVKKADKPKKTVSAAGCEQLSEKEQDIYDLIKRRRLQMLIHSCLYYRLNTNIITDQQFDKWARELRDLQKENPKISSEVEWAEEFEDWDGTTGFNLPLSNPWVVSKALYISRISEGRE